MHRRKWHGQVESRERRSLSETCSPLHLFHVASVGPREQSDDLPEASMRRRSHRVREAERAWVGKGARGRGKGPSSKLSALACMLCRSQDASPSLCELCSEGDPAEEQAATALQELGFATLHPVSKIAFTSNAFMVESDVAHAGRKISSRYNVGASKTNAGVTMSSSSSASGSMHRCVLNFEHPRQLRDRAAQGHVETISPLKAVLQRGISHWPTLEAYVEVSTVWRGARTCQCTS